MSRQFAENPEGVQALTDASETKKSKTASRTRSIFSVTGPAAERRQNGADWKRFAASGEGWGR
jgi:hypothetical protein